MTTFLTYGQTIRIHCVIPGEENAGFITSKSFTDPTLYYQTSNISKNTTNYRQSLFQILPKSSFDINDEMNKALTGKAIQLKGRAKTERQQFEAIVAKKKGQDICFGAQVVFKHIDSGYYICGSTDCARSGVGAFKIFLSPNLSSDIIFTLHSNRTYEKEGDKIGLKGPIKIYHNNTLCYLSFEQDPIFLDLKLPTCLLDSEEQDNGQQKSNYLSQPMSRPLIKKINGSRFQLINQNTLKRVWRFEEHQQGESKKSKQLITDHDLVYFIHTKDNKYLVPHLNNQSVYLKKRIDQQPLGDFFDGVWEIQDFITQTSNLQISKNQSTRGRSDEIKSAKIARHMSSGKVLVFNQKSDAPKLKQYSSNFDKSKYDIPMQINYTTKQLEESTLVKFQCFKIGQYLSDQQTYQIQRYMMDAISQKDSDKDSQSKTQLIHEQIQTEQKNFKNTWQQKTKSIKQSYEAFFEKSQLKIVSKMEEHGFRIFKLSTEYKRLLLYVLSAQELLSKFTDFIKVKDIQFFKEHMNYWLLTNVINTLKDLIGFIYNCDYSTIIGNSPIAQRQKLFQEVGMIQLVSELLKQIHTGYRRHSEALLQRGSQFSKLRAIYRHGYQILESMAKNNKKIKLRISFFLQEYLQQMVETHNKQVYKSITQMLIDNYQAIEKLVSVQMIKILIRSFEKRPPDPANLKFLSHFCLCEDRSVKENQNAIFEQFYNTIQGDEQVAPDSDKFKFREQRNSIQINSTISKSHRPSYRTLPELFRDCEGMIEQGQQQQKQKGHWKYFIQYLNLLADICVHRNQKAQQYVGGILPLKRLVAFLKQDIVTQQSLYQPFIRLVHYAHVQNKDYDEIRRITKVKSWNQTQKLDIPVAKTPIKKELQSILKQITNYIQKINNTSKSQQSTIILDHEDMLQLRNIETFLQILKSTLNLGFWKTINDLKAMVPCMLRILKFDINNKNNPQKRRTSKDNLLSEAKGDKSKSIEQTKIKLTLKKPEIKLLIRCKILAAQILDIILDNENSIRVSILTNIFKDIVQENLNFERFVKDQPQNDFKNRLRSIKDYEKFKPTDKQINIFRQNIWTTKLTQMINQRNVFSEVDLKELNPTLILFEISHYRDEVLSNYCLSILSRIYGQRKQIMDNLANIIIVSKGNLDLLSKRSVDTRGRLLVLASYNVLNIKPRDKQFLDLWAASKNDNKIGVIQELAYLTIQMKRNISLSDHQAMTIYKYQSLYPYHPQTQIDQQYDMDTKLETKLSKHENIPPAEKTYPIITEKDQNNTLHQSLIKSQDHHLILFEFIKMMKQKPQSDISMKVLHAVYNFLTVLIWNHNENKKQLTYFLKYSKVHLKYNIGCLDFFRQMYTNNKSLIRAESDVTQLVDHVVSIANELELTSYYKSKLIDFLRVLAIFDDKGDTKNQNIIMEVISRYQVASNNKTVFILNSRGDLKISEQWAQSYQSQYKQSKQRGGKLRISPQLTYLATFFEIFGALIQDDNIINLGKCTNMHPYQQLVKLLSKSRHCWPLIRHLRAYINKLYYSKGRQFQSQFFDIFIENEFQNIVKQLEQIVKLKENHPEINTIRIDCPIRYTYLNSYIFLAMQQILISLQLMLSNTDFSSYLNVTISSPKESRPYHNIMNIAEMIGYLMKNVHGRVINCLMAQVQGMLKSIMILFSKDVLENYKIQGERLTAVAMKNSQQYVRQNVVLRKRYGFHDNKTIWMHLVDWYSFHKAEKTRQRMQQSVQAAAENLVYGRQDKMSNDNEKQNLADIICLGDIQKKIKVYRKTGTMSFTNAPAPSIFQPIRDADQDKIRTFVPRNLVISKSKHFRLKNQPDLPSEKQNVLLNSRRIKLCVFFNVNPIFNQFKHEQFYNLCEQFTNIDKLSSDKYGQIAIGKADVIKSFVEMNQENPNFLKVDLKLNFLRLLTNYIVKHNTQTYKQKNVGEWETSDWLNYTQPIQQAQLFLNSCHCAKFICSTIKYNLGTDVTMANHLFEFAIAFLLGGNRQCQNSFIQIFLKDQKNIIFTKLEQMIKHYADRVSLVKANRIKDQIRQDIVSDTYDFYDDTEGNMIRKFRYHEETSEQQKLEDDIIQALNRLYRFIQLLCQGNNSRMKNFIRNQVSQQNKVKSNSVDFIDITNVEIRRFFKSLNKRIIDLPLSLIEFIYQVTQLPCVDNQIALCKGTFYQDVCRVNRELSDTKAKQSVGLSEQQNTILLKIYNKSIEIALSCLQGNQDKIFEDLSVKIQAGFLVSVIKSNLQNLNFAIDWKDPLCEQKIIKSLKDIQNKQSTYSSQMQMILKIVSVVLKIQAWIVQGQHTTNNFMTNFKQVLQQQKMTQIFKFLESNLLCIEVKTTSKQIVYFPFHPAFNYLSDSTKDKIMFQANRVTSRDKLIGLIKTRQQITNEINYNFYLDHLQPISFLPAIPINSRTIQQFRRYAQIISVIICIIISFTADVTYYPDSNEVDFQSGKRVDFILNILCILQFGFTSLYAALWAINRSVLAVCKYEEQQKEGQQQDKSKSELEQQSLVSQFFSFVKEILFKVYPIKCAYCLIAYQSDSLGVMIFFLSSFLGAFYRIQYFSLHMFFLVTQINLLTNVFQAITINVKLLGLVSLLGLSFIVIFSIFSFNSYVQSVYSDDIPIEHCQSIAQCIITLYISQQIGNDVSTFQASRFIFDILYNVFMAMLFGNIISGIMIDTFGQLRDTKTSIQKDKKNNCFICGITLETLQKQGILLPTHYMSKHHLLWNYVFYLYHIFLKKESKSNDSFTGLQYIILDKNKDNEQDVTWIPVQDDQQQQKNTQIKDLVVEVQRCRQRVQMIELPEIQDSEI